MGPCMCGDTACHSCGPLQGYDPTMEYATFERFELEMTRDHAMQCSHQGSCDADVEYVLCEQYIIDQLDKIGDEAIKDELEEYGAWDDVELSSAQMNRARIVWCAANNISEEISHANKD